MWRAKGLSPSVIRLSAWPSRLSSLPRAATRGALTLFLICCVTVAIQLVRLPSTLIAIGTPELRVAVACITLVAWAVGSLALFLFPAQRDADRLHWVGLGLLVAAVPIVFGLFYPGWGSGATLQGVVAARLIVWAVAIGVIAIGEVPREPPTFSWLWGATLFIGVCLTFVALIGAGDIFPWLTMGDHSQSLGSALRESPPRSSVVYRIATAPLLAVTLFAALSMVARKVRRPFERWTLFMLVVIASAQLHQIVWPSSINPFGLLTPVPQLGFGIFLAVGGMIEFRRVADAWSASLVAARSERKQLADLAVLQANLSAMAAHELGAHTAAVLRITEMLATGEVKGEREKDALATLNSEAGILATLSKDVALTGSASNEDFTIALRPVSLEAIFKKAMTFGASLDGEHTFACSGSLDVTVLVDERRIEQVLDNLLDNAAKYSNSGSHIELKASQSQDRIRIDIVDQGFGIRPEDMTRVFERYIRGRQQSNAKVSGLGVGLYLARRIVRAHGSDLTVVSSPNPGSTFTFSLKIVE